MIHPLSLVTKKGSSFVYESSLFVRGKASIGIDQLGGECFERCSEFLLYLSHYMYHCLVTFTYIVVLLLFIYMMMYVISTLSHMCCFFSLFIHMSFLLYNLSLFHT